MKRYLLLVFALALVLSGCGYNTLQAEDEAVSAAWSEVLNQYQRRADLVPNLVNTVKGYAAHEKDVLLEVTAARTQVGSVPASPDLIKDDARFGQYQQAQAGMTQALSHLMVVAERYPDLKASNNFRDLAAQLEGTENRITVARNRYIKAVQAFNTTVRSFPSNLTANATGLKAKPNFAVQNEQKLGEAPKVEFGAKQ
ncbi:LemA family protein [Andreprevotia chitinilytica]|uniref:LemA family protein n=1 Tax=Andreprevotia chitinilytica TaxID=396808 RepID=UPI00054E7527|nr:LemA family protein [Andreprevotia chitinilytica]